MTIFHPIKGMYKVRFFILLLVAYAVVSCEEPVLYTLTFESNGGLPVAAQKIQEGARATKPDDPTRDEFTFVGWYKDQELTQVFNFETDIIISSITLYASWTIGPYTVTFDSQGGTEVDAQRVESNGLVDLPNSPTRENFAFVGWYTDKTFDIAMRFNFDVSPTMGFTLYAKWANAADYTLTNGKLTSMDNATAAIVEIPSNVNGEEVTELLGTSPNGMFGQNFSDNNSTMITLLIPPSVTIIGESAFTSCISLVNVELPSALITIGKNAFSGCTSLKTIEVPPLVLSIGESAFYDCPALNDIELPSTITFIGASAFVNCRSLTAITWPSSAPTISTSTFSGCVSLVNVVIPNAVQSIGSNAFFNCSSLPTIVLPGTVTNMDDRAFSSCSALTSIRVEATTPPTLAINAFEGTSNELDIMVPSASEVTYRSAVGWKRYAGQISGY